MHVSGGIKETMVLRLEENHQLEIGIIYKHV